MLDAIALYFMYQSNHVILLRIVTTDLDLLPCTSRKDKTDSDLIRNTVTRMLHSLFKLMNSKWELNMKLERQLYLACITIISDYDIEIWWNNQKSHAIKFHKLQNAALWKILRAFWTSFIKVMQIEIEISSVKVQLN